MYQIHGCSCKLSLICRQRYLRAERLPYRLGQPRSSFRPSRVPLRYLTDGENVPPNVGQQPEVQTEFFPRSTMLRP